MTSNRIVTSTIIRPDSDSDTRKKRSFPDAPEPVRRNNITSRLGRPSSSSSAALSTNHESKDAAATGASMETNTTTTEPVASSSSTTGASAAGNNTTADSEMNEGGNEHDDRDRAKRPRISANPVEDAKRGRRMMGMILGTLTQFKKDETSAAGEAKSSGAASRAALQERVREKLRKEQELNAERMKKEREERDERLKQQQANRQAGRRPNQRRGLVKWENGYLLTETKPRLRYMPKVMNEETRKKHEAQIQATGEGAPPTREAASTTTASGSAPASFVSDIRAESAAGMELDMEDVAMEVVVDVKDSKDTNTSEVSESTSSSANEPASQTAPSESISGTSNDIDKEKEANKGSESGDLVNTETPDIPESDLISISLV